MGSLKDEQQLSNISRIEADSASQSRKNFNNDVDSEGACQSSASSFVCVCVKGRKGEAWEEDRVG